MFRQINHKYRGSRYGTIADRCCGLRAATVACTFALAISVLAIPTPSFAENPALSAVSGALKKGKYSYALKTLNKALKAGKLNTQDMSKALFYRGLTYQAQKKPAQSIADLTNAIWMGGLSTAERAEALKYRALAYQEGGLSDRAKADRAEATRLARGLPKTPPTLGAPIKKIKNTSSESGGFGSGVTSGISNFFGNILPGSSSGASTAASTTAATTSTVKTAQNVASATASTTASSAASSSTKVATSAWPAARVTTSRAAKPVATGWSTNVNQTALNVAKPKPPAPAPSGSGFGFGGVSNFFGNVFGGSPSTPKVKKPTQTAALDIAKTAPVTAPVITSPPQGRYKLQIATVRSRDEASTIVSSLSARHGSVVAAHPAHIDEAVVGNMGTFYRVRLGAFNSEKTALKTCNKLRASGLDCFPVAR